MSNEHNCPRCNAPFLYFTQINTRVFYCGSDAQIPSTACRYASQLQDHIKRLEEDLMDANNQYAVLIADVVLYEDRGDRIKRLEEAGDELLRDNEDMANINRWHKAKYE